MTKGNKIYRQRQGESFYSACLSGQGMDEREILQMIRLFVIDEVNVVKCNYT